jgi:hypothetical protein
MKIQEYLPTSGWLYDYLTYTKSIPKELTEVPMIFNLFMGITAIGAALGRDVYVDQGAYKIYSDIRVVLIAPTGKGKKTTAINFAQKLIVKSQVTRILAENITPESLCESLSSGKVKLKHGQVVEEPCDATGLLILPELSVFLERRDYKSGLVPLLTRLGDAPDDFTSSTISRGLRPLHNVALCVMAGSAKSWLTDSVPVDAFRGGFMSRFLFVCSEGAEKPVSRPPQFDKELEAQLIKRLKAFANLEGEVPIHPDAQAFYDRWYNNAYHHRSLDEKRAAYQERKHVWLLRVAMVLAIADNRDIINILDVSKSLGLLDYIEEEMFALFGEIERGTTPQGEAMQMVLSYVKKKGTLGRTELLRRLVSKGITSSVIDEIITSLEAGGFVKTKLIQGNGTKKSTIYIYQGESTTTEGEQNDVKT